MPYAILLIAIGILGVLLSFSDYVGDVGWVIRLLAGLGIVGAVALLIWRSRTSRD